MSNQAGVQASYFKAAEASKAPPANLKKVNMCLKEKYENYLGVQR